jgi:hypothetical protein
MSPDRLAAPEKWPSSSVSSILQVLLLLGVIVATLLHFEPHDRIEDCFFERQNHIAILNRVAGLHISLDKSSAPRGRFLLVRTSSIELARGKSLYYILKCMTAPTF